MGSELVAGTSLVVICNFSYLKKRKNLSISLVHHIKSMPLNFPTRSKGLFTKYKHLKYKPALN